MKIQEKDYVLVSTSGSKKSGVVRVTDAADPKKLRGILDMSHVEEAETKSSGDVVTFSKKDVVANLGSRPQFGTAYGAKVEVVRKKFSHDWFGKIRIFASCLDDDKLMADFKTHLRTAEKMVRKQRLPQLPLLFDVRHQAGKYAGMYKHRRGNLDVLTVRVAENDVNEDYIKYIVAHEYAHGVWCRHVPAKIKRKWIYLYHQATTVKTVGKRELEQLLEDLKTAGSVNAFKKELETDDRKLLAAVFKHVKATHQLDHHHVQLLLSLEEEIDFLWPTQIEIGNADLVLTSYAEVSPEELFAESFALWMTGKKLPKQVQNAVEKTMSNLSKTDLDEADQSAGSSDDEEDDDE